MRSHLHFLALAASCALLFSSCASDATDSTVQEQAPTSQPQQINQAPDMSVPALNVAPTSPSSSTASGLNPPHGEPGHVCEIPVGEPLNGSGKAAGATNQTINMAPPTNGATPTFSTMPPGSPVNKAAPSGGGSGRMNPAHGEPGHVCEVPVGQPLP